jgi:hypothetical protein
LFKTNKKTIQRQIHQGIDYIIWFIIDTGDSLNKIGDAIKKGISGIVIGSFALNIAMYILVILTFIGHLQWIYYGG